MWNARGPNSLAKRRAVFQVVVASGAAAVCLQESKLQLVTTSIVHECMGPDFSQFFFLPAVGTRGGIILGWKACDVILSNPHYSDHAVTARINSPDCC